MSSWRILASVLAFAISALLPAASRADVITTPNFVVGAPDLSHLVTIEGSGPCGPSFGGCDSLDITFTSTNTSGSALSLNFAGGAAAFMSGDPSDSFVNSVWNGAPTCFPSLGVGASCSVTLFYITGLADGGTDSGLNGTNFFIGDQFGGFASIDYRMTILDSAAPPSAPAPASLALLGLGLAGLGLSRRKRR